MSMTAIIIDKVKKILADTVFDINAVVFCSTLGIAVLMTIVSVVITKCRIVMFDVDQTQMSTLFTTTAQIVGGLYGLTLTAYVFFVDKFRDSTKDDETLYDATNAVLSNLFAGLISISILCEVIIVTSLFGIANLSRLSSVEYWLINENVLIFVLEIVAILFFGVQLLDPKKLDKELNRMKRADDKKNSTQNAPAKKENVAEFFELYNKLEADILSIAQHYVPVDFLKGRAGKPGIIRGLQILNESQIINNNVRVLIDDLRKYRNSVAHGLECSVTDSRLEEVRNIESAMGQISLLLAERKENTEDWENAIKRLYDLSSQL